MSNDCSDLCLIAGNSNPPLAARIAEHVGVPLTDTTVTTFPDSETFVKINDNIRGRDVFIIQSTCPPANHNLMELLIMTDAVRRASADRITAVIPFYGYARQDRKDQPRVPITAKLVANLITAAGANRILSMDLHAQQIQGFFDIPVDHLYAAPVLHKYFLDRKMKDLVIVSPDVGGLKMAYAYSNMLHAGLAIVAKRRKSATEVESLNLIGDVKGANVILVDDLTETAGTLASASTFLKDAGAHNVYAVVSHAVLGKMGMERLRKSAIKELVTTDSVPHPARKGFPLVVLSVAPLLGEAIRRIHCNSSVTSLFEVNGQKLSH
ncbi:MAG: ribose-phosphate pyrophosphokinase [Verrucomicrobia bacterium]|nr:ribose-phosphate pyrophosphokinase [Verrucomicrobiota bacterium]